MDQFEQKFVVSPEGETSIEKHKSEELDRARAFADAELRKKVEAWAERHASGAQDKQVYLKIYEGIYADEMEKARIEALERIERMLEK